LSISVFNLADLMIIGGMIVLLVSSLRKIIHKQGLSRMAIFAIMMVVVI